MRKKKELILRSGQKARLDSKRDWLWAYNAFVWPIKQLFPLTYTTEYHQEEKKHVAIWKMWLGRCYKKQDYVVME